MKIKLTNNEPFQINALINNTPKVIDVVSDIEGKQDKLVSGINIKTINNTSLLGNGDITVQTELVSGVDVKTINNNSIVGSGNLTISASDPTIINDMTSSTTFNQAMAPNVVYIVGSTSNPVTSFTITSLTSTGNDAEYYQAIIYCGSNMSFTRPATVKMGDNRSLPTFFSNTVFEINIFQNILTFTYTNLS